MLVGGNVGYTYVGKGFSDIVHSVAINDYGTLGAGISISSPVISLHPRLMFNVNNILNETVPVSGTTASSTIGTTVSQYILNPPRTFILRLSLDI